MFLFPVADLTWWTSKTLTFIVLLSWSFVVRFCWTFLLLFNEGDFPELPFLDTLRFFTSTFLWPWPFTTLHFGPLIISVTSFVSGVWGVSTFPFAILAFFCTLEYGVTILFVVSKADFHHWPFSETDILWLWPLNRPWTFFRWF